MLIKIVTSNTLTYLFHYLFKQKFHCKEKKNLYNFVCLSTMFSVQQAWCIILISHTFLCVTQGLSIKVQEKLWSGSISGWRDLWAIQYKVSPHTHTFLQPPLPIAPYYLATFTPTGPLPLTSLCHCLWFCICFLRTYYQSLLSTLKQNI